MRKATYQDVETAWRALVRYLPDENLAIERWGKKVRIIRRDNSRPFGSNYQTYTEAYEMIWFAVNALRLAGVKRQSD